MSASTKPNKILIFCFYPHQKKISWSRGKICKAKFDNLVTYLFKELKHNQGLTVQALGHLKLLLTFFLLLSSIQKPSSLQKSTMARPLNIFILTDSKLSSHTAWTIKPGKNNFFVLKDMEIIRFMSASTKPQNIFKVSLQTWIHISNQLINRRKWALFGKKLKIQHLSASTKPKNILKASLQTWIHISNQLLNRKNGLCLERN